MLRRIDSVLEAAFKQALTLQLLGVSAVHVEVLIDRLRHARFVIHNRRYLGRGNYRKRSQKFELYLSVDHDNASTDKEFLFHFRMSRNCYWQLVELIANHPVFLKKNSDSRGKAPKPASHQLLVLLKYYGSEGNSASSVSLGSFFGIGHGAVDRCKEAALEGVLSLEDRTYFWPDAEERKVIANRIRDTYLFPNCVGIIDGTLLPLLQRPLLHGENYLSRKKFYAIVMLVVCDDQCRIIYYHIGWPGSVHDNRAWRNSRLYRKFNEYFSHREYLLGDSAFTASDIMIPPFKAYAGSFLTNNQEAFNTLLSKPRVKSEHCIGILKGRFPFLKAIRMLLGNKLHMDRIIKYVRGSVVLHNFLVSEPFDEDWINANEGMDDLDPESTMTTSNEPDYARRQELLYYLSELEETTNI